MTPNPDLGTYSDVINIGLPSVMGKGGKLDFIVYNN